jgi:hypothetical protein
MAADRPFRPMGCVFGIRKTWKGEGSMKYFAAFVLIAGAMPLAIGFSRKAATPAKATAPNAKTVNPTVGKRRPKDFAFDFRYGSCITEELDAFRGKMSRTMTGIPPRVEVGCRLPSSEMDRIYREMKKIGFFDYPANFTPRQIGPRHVLVSPHPSYALRIRCNGATKTIAWEDSSDGLGHLGPKSRAAGTVYDAKSNAMYGLIALLKRIVESQPAYKKLPKLNVGCM